MMKKLLGILIVGLLVCSLPKQSEALWGTNFGAGKIKKGTSEYVYIGDNHVGSGQPQAHRVATKYCKKYDKFAFYYGMSFTFNYTIYYCFKDYKTSHVLTRGLHRGLKKVVWTNHPDHLKKIAEEKKKIDDAKEKIAAAAALSPEEKKQIKVTSMVDDAKNTCKDLGFEEGTDRFVDCSFKLYTQKVELAAKNNQQIVVQGQSSGSNVMTIYDPVRDSNAALKRGQGLINGTCTLGNLSTC